MCGFVRICRNAFEACDVDEGFISRLVRGFGSTVDGLQLFSGIKVALVAAGYVVVHLDSENVALLGFRNDGGNAIAIQTVAGNAHVMRPVVAIMRVLRTACRARKNADECKREICAQCVPGFKIQRELRFGCAVD
jgi:hypothetical protein